MSKSKQCDLCLGKGQWQDRKCPVSMLVMDQLSVMDVKIKANILLANHVSIMLPI